ncbi:MAG: hypothetical protein ACLGI6_09440 [Gammaproteobacteria bacterium]
MRTVLSPILAVLCACALLGGCSPKYNWRDYTGKEAPYQVMFPDKPASHTRAINLDGLTVNMTMTAAEVDGVSYAVGTAQAPDEARARAAVAAMKTALVKNIGATVQREKASAPATLDIEATGVQNGQPIRLVGHFEARKQRVYQVIVLGRPAAMPAEQVETFMSSFKLN